MLLLDHNIQKRLMTFLTSIGVLAKRSAEMGWAEKRNGDLVEACSQNGFTAILTNDQDFANSAATSLKRFSTVAIVILTLDQGPIDEYLPRFSHAWKNDPPTFTPGRVTFWP